MFCDNTSAVAWAYKGGTSRSIPAGRLLRLLSLRQRTRKASSLLPMHIAGENNAMADISSRASKNGEYFHAHENLVKYFNSHFPLPQNLSWQEFQVSSKMASHVISCLRGIQLPMESLHRLTQEKYWQHWSGYCHNFGLDPFLPRQTAYERAVILTGFAARVRTGAYRNGNQVNVQTVANTLSAISKTNQLVGKQSPVLEKEGE